jgi:DNA-binding CsgD family transcriptional regulator
VSGTPRYLSVSGVQRELGLTRDQVTELIEVGALSAFQIFGEWRVERVMLDRLVDKLYEASEYPHRDSGKAPAAGATRRERAARAHADTELPATEHQGRNPLAENHPRRTHSHVSPGPVSRSGTDAMTPQQQRIGQLVGQGLSNADIAKHLSLEVSTVKSHVSRMLQRLNLDGRQQLIAHLWRTGFMAGSDPGAEGLAASLVAPRTSAKPPGARAARAAVQQWPRRRGRRGLAPKARTLSRGRGGSPGSRRGPRT